MRHSPECIPCLMGRVLFQSRLLDNGKEAESMEAALKTYAETISKEPNSARLATKVHKSSYDALCSKDPYHDLKVRADEVALKYTEQVEEFIENSEDRFKAAVKVAIMGNIMDFGANIAIESPEEFDEIFDSLLEMDLAVDDTDKMKRKIGKNKTVVYFFDNCGETVFDIPLIRQIRAMGGRVVGVVRGEPILNDAALDDALRIGLEKEVDRILTTGAFAIGVDMRMIGKDLLEEMKRADLIIAKGMANFESLGEEVLWSSVAYLLKAKCAPVASAIGSSVGSNVAKLVDQNRTTKIQ